MSVPKVYRWDDNEAPPLVCDPIEMSSSLIKVVKACLVDGYGDKTPPGLGYSLEHIEDDFSAMAIKSLNPLSNGFYYQIATADAYLGTSGNASFQAYVDMYDYMPSAKDNKVGGTSDNCILYTAFSASYPNDKVPWVIVADDRFFYIFTWCSTPTHRVSQSPDMSVSSACSAACLGDFVSFGSDPWSSIVYGQTASTAGGHFGNMTKFTASNYLSNSLKYKRSVKGLPGSTGGTVSPLDPLYAYQGYTSTMGVPNSTNKSFEFADNTPVMISRPILAEIIEAEQPRGYIPGLYYPIHDKPYENLEEVTINGKNFLAILITVFNSRLGQVLISLDDWRA